MSKNIDKHTVEKKSKAEPLTQVLRYCGFWAYFKVCFVSKKLVENRKFWLP